MDMKGAEATWVVIEPSTGGRRKTSFVFLQCVRGKEGDREKRMK
jgi:hypothetical protein